MCTTSWPTSSRASCPRAGREAIRYCLAHAEPGDIVVLAGKGHESYLEVRGKRTHYDEREVVAGILAGKL